MIPYGDLFLGIVSTIMGYVVMLKFSPRFFRLERSALRTVNYNKIHIHHDLIGLIIMFSAFAIPNAKLQIVVSGLGFGFFLNHVFTEGFKFVTKAK